ncbi:hypothetical protein FQA47_021765 [Oryzias melastigma]|uniref:Uncharacterized protein n=1 Tax=Oryzias melastigma TaxID=30732 RepID=A0A834EZ53_ORYME|nr:hypothetical protein FQA47_021765 [Oryzias melastigma]
MQSKRTMAPVGMVSSMSWFGPLMFLVSAVALLILSILLITLCTNCQKNHSSDYNMKTKGNVNGNAEMNGGGSHLENRRAAGQPATTGGCNTDRPGSTEPSSARLVPSRRNSCPNTLLEGGVYVAEERTANQRRSSTHTVALVYYEYSTLIG